MKLKHQSAVLTSQTKGLKKAGHFNSLTRSSVGGDYSVVMKMDLMTKRCMDNSSSELAYNSPWQLSKLDPKKNSRKMGDRLWVGIALTRGNLCKTEIYYYYCTSSKKAIRYFKLKVSVPLQTKRRCINWETRSCNQENEDDWPVTAEHRV